ncbi:MAG: hypothetical protein ABIS92_03840 [Polyangia bacterium]
MPKLPKATQADVVNATMAALVSSAQAHYAAMMAAAVGMSHGERSPSKTMQQDGIAKGYDMVIAQLPPGSPFIGPLQDHRDTAVRKLSSM